LYRQVQLYEAVHKKKKQKARVNEYREDGKMVDQGIGLFGEFKSGAKMKK
jgi:hypothetical protein